MNAFDMTPFMIGAPYPPPIDMDPTVEAMERALRDVAAEVRRAWGKTESVLVRGTPLDVILETAAARGCDLIVIGSHGRRGIARVMLGSVAEKVARFSPIRVLTVHPAPRNGARHSATAKRRHRQARFVLSDRVRRA